MDDNKKLLLQRVAEDDKLLEALKEFLTDEVSEKPSLSLNNEELGASIRASEHAKQFINEGIKNLKKLKTNKTQTKSELNPGK